MFVAPEMRLGFGRVLWLRVWICVFQERISNAGMREGFGTVQPPGKMREKRGPYKERVKEPDTWIPYARRLWAVGVYPSFRWRGNERGEGETYTCTVHGIAWPWAVVHGWDSLCD